MTATDHGGGTSRLRIIVLGYMVRGPLGGMVWSNLQFVDGLARLGHDVYFIEDSDDYPSCYDPSRNIVDEDPAYGLRFVARVFERIGFTERWAYFDAHKGQWHGPASARIGEVCATAELVLNLCGVNPLRPWLMNVPARALVDEDPCFTQIRHLTDDVARARARQHTAFLSFAENIGDPCCTVPADGFPWQPVRQPVVLDSLARTTGKARANFTTVMQWESYPACVHQGVRYGMKSESFGPYLDLPRRAGPVLEMAVGGASAPRAELTGHGWTVRDPAALSRDPWTYLAYLEQSKAEFSVAKHGYVASRSGWFSERSVAYLASGRPVVIQDTGFGSWLKTDAGVLAFSDPDQALAAIGNVNDRYELHCEAARAVAEEYFDSRKVLPRLIERALDSHGA